MKRSKKNPSIGILFNGTMIPTTFKENYVANPKKKSLLISMNIDKFSSSDITCKQP